MDTIIAATDFSYTANNAVNYSLELAKFFKARVILVHACSVPSVSYEATSYAEVISGTYERAKQKLESFKDELQANYDIDIECVVEMGTPYEVVDAVAQKNNADLIVVGINNKMGAIKEYIIGSTALKIARNQGTATFIIPDGISYQPVKKIGFACNVKTNQEKDRIFIVRYFTEIFGAELEMVKVENPFEEQNIEQLQTNLFMENKLAKVKHKTVELQGTDILYELEEYFNSNPPDVIMVNPKKHNLFYYLFNESITKELALHAVQPILAIH